MISITNAHVIVGNGVDLDRACVRIDGNRIVEVCSEANPADIVVDLEGRTLMPGMIDAHTHLCGGDRAMAFDDEAAGWRMSEPLAKAVLDSVDAATVTLNSGVTTVRDAGTRDFIDVFLREAQRSGQVDSPRVFACGPGLFMTGGHGSYLAPGYEADGPNEMVKRVRWMIANGVDVVKVVSADGPQTLGDWCTVQSTAEEITAAFMEARRLGRSTMAHAMGPGAIENVVSAGVDTVEHGWYLDEASCELMIGRGTYLVPTLGCAVDIIEKGPSLMMPWAEMMAADEDGIFDRLEMALDLGVKVAMGSDCGGNEARIHGRNADELIHYSRLGLSSNRAIETATLNAAKALRIDAQLGSVAPGKLADLIVVDGDPLTYISLVRTSVVGVLQDGRVVRDDLGIFAPVRSTEPARLRTTTAIELP